MYEQCIAWVSSTDCLAMTSMYQLLHPDWRKFPHRLQYGWTQDHEELLLSLHTQILNGEVSSSYYSSESEYEMAGKKHFLHHQRPFLSKPLKPTATPGVDGDSVDDVLAMMQFAADDEYDVHPPDIAYTEREIDSMCLSTSRRSSQASINSADPYADFQVYSYDALTNCLRVTSYTLVAVDFLAPRDTDFSSWVVLSMSA